MREQRNGFSLMEMMVVLLIVAIIAAASAPMVSKNMARNAGSGDSPWVFTGTSNSIAYNMRGDANSSAIIGATKLPSGLAVKPKLYIQSKGNEPQLTFGDNNGLTASLVMDSTNGRVGLSNLQINNNTVALGTNQTADGSTTRTVIIGNDAEVQGEDTTAIGYDASASGLRSTSIGICSNTFGDQNTVIGYKASASGGSYNVVIGEEASASQSYSVAVGNSAQVVQPYSVALGYNLRVDKSHSVAIGYGAKVTQEHQIVLGTANDTVYIPGNLVVAKGIAAYQIGAKDQIASGGRMYSSWNTANSGGGADRVDEEAGKHGNISMPVMYLYNSYIGKDITSDRRLKNVGEKFTSGLEKIKKLEVYNYTFKKDETKTPHVGVIAQDLKKVFPDAVTKGEDGYLRIRFEDMFYALVNAVKELDEKITNAFDNIANLNKRLDDQEKIIKQLQEQNKKLETRLAELEKK